MIVVGGEALIDLVLGIDGSVSAKLGGGRSTWSTTEIDTWPT